MHLPYQLFCVLNVVVANYYGAYAWKLSLPFYSADDHDVTSFQVFSIRPKVAIDQGQQQIDEARKIETEYEEYQKKLKELREKYQKEHPEEATGTNEEFLTELDKDILTILDGQSAIKGIMNSLQLKVDTLLMKQEQALSSLLSIQQVSLIRTKCARSFPSMQFREYLNGWEI